MRFIKPNRLVSLAVFLLAAGCALLLVAGSVVRGAGAAPAKTAAVGADSAAKINFQDNIEPIFRDNCFDCHDPDTKKAGLDLTTVPAILAGSSSGKVAKPGDPDGSKLYRVLAHQDRPFMPKDADKLSEKELAVIKQWITQGMLANSSSKAAPTPATPLAIASPAVGRPAGPPPMPTVSLSRTLIVHTGRTSPLASLAASPWAPLAAVGGQHEILLYNTNNLDLLGVLPFEEGLPDCLHFSRNGALLIAAGGEGARLGKVVVFSVATGKRIAEVGDEYDQVLAADISPDQSLVALGGPSKLLKVFATSNPKKPLYVVKKHTDWVTAVAFSPDGKLLASGDRAGNLYLFAADSGGEMCTLSGHRDAISAVVFRDDGNALASASQDGTVKLWDPHSGELIKTISAGGGGETGGLTDVAFSHDGQIVVASRDKYVRLFSSDGGGNHSFGPFADMVLHAVFTDDGQRIIAGDFTGEISVFKIANAQRIGDLSEDPLTPAERAAHLGDARKLLAEAEARQNQATAALTAAQAAETKAEVDLREARSARTTAYLASRHAADALLEMTNAHNGAGVTPVARPALPTTQGAAEAPLTIAQATEKVKALRAVSSAAGQRVLAAERATREARDTLAMAKAMVDSTAVDVAFAQHLIERYQPPMPVPAPVSPPAKH